MRKISFLMVVIVLLLGGAVRAQDAAVAPVRVEVSAADGLTLVGDWYAVALDAEILKPGVILMHMYGSSRSAWEPLVPALVEAGYNVLNVDLRGHGETGGDEDWEAAVGDVQTWADWLRQQSGVNSESLAMIGGSIGSNLALIGCANEPACLTAIALSPGLDYYGVMPENALVEGLRQRSALIFSAHGDLPSGNDVKQMVASAKGEVSLMLFTGSTHGTSMLTSPKLRKKVIPAILQWLGQYAPAS